MPASLNGQREGGRERGRASADLERRTSWWTADWSGVTCDWTAEWAGHRLLARLCCPFVLPPEYHHHPSTLTLRNSPITQWYRRLGSATKSTRAHTHTHPITRIHQCWALRMHIYAERCGNFLCQCVNCSCRIRLVMACSVPVLCGMCESALIVFMHMNFRVTLSFCA